MMKMKKQIATWMTSALLLTGIQIAQADTSILYCKKSQPVTAEEAHIMPHLVKAFAQKMGCEIGNNCLTKNYEKKAYSNFSIAWKESCGPIIHGVHQLGNQGTGSTFMCEKKIDGNTCCWPLGYDYDESYIVCVKP